jgi:hypothetical protein
MIWKDLFRICKKIVTKSDIMTKTVLHKADSRGYANHGWLISRHTFSFANYYNPDRIHFGELRVLNNDTVEAGKGFGIWDTDTLSINVDADSEFLLMEVPMVV